MPPGKRILVPLTTSLYVPGILADTERVIVDVGTGFYVEKVWLIEYVLQSFHHWWVIDHKRRYRLLQIEDRRSGWESERSRENRTEQVWQFKSRGRWSVSSFTLMLSSQISTIAKSEANSYIVLRQKVISGSEGSNATASAAWYLRSLSYIHKYHLWLELLTSRRNLCHRSACQTLPADCNFATVSHFHCLNLIF